MLFRPVPTVLTMASILGGWGSAWAQPLPNVREYVYAGDRLVAIVRPDNPAVVGVTATSVSVAESATSVVLVVRLTTATGGVTVNPVTVDFATANGSAASGADYVAVTGTLSFPLNTPHNFEANVTVTLLPDTLDEFDEDFFFTLANPSGATIGAATETVTILDDDLPPSLSVADVSQDEGDEGAASAPFPVTLSAASGKTVSASYATANGTATAGQDYTASSGGLTFNPGETSKLILVPITADIVDEPAETFFVNVTAPINATLADGQAQGTILDDDPAAGLSKIELIHATDRTTTFRTSTLHWYRISQKPRSSYEVLVDATSGDIGGVLSPLLVQRVDPDATTVLQNGVAVPDSSGIGFSRSLRFENATAGVVSGELLKVASGSCNPCTGNDLYRLRVFETTCALPRFNNAGSQVTVVVIENPANYAVAGTLWFSDGAGNLLASQPLSLAAKGALALNTALLPGLAGTSGSVTISHNGRHGDLSGKAVSVEAATGFSFDTPLVCRQ